MKTFPDLHKADPPLSYRKVPLPIHCFGCKVIFVVLNLIKSFSLNWRSQRVFLGGWFFVLVLFFSVEAFNLKIWT